MSAGSRRSRAPGRVSAPAASTGRYRPASTTHIQFGPAIAKRLRTIGSTNSTPTVTAMAAAPLRSRKPKPTPMRVKHAIDTTPQPSGTIESAGDAQSIPAVVKGAVKAIATA